MYLAGADAVRIPTILSGMEMASHILHPEIGNWWYSGLGQSARQAGLFQQVNLSEKSEWVGQTVAYIHSHEQILIVTVKRNDTFLTPPPYDLLLAAADIVIILRKT
jgi:Trk K+ transport system NAD-binding subunit